MDARIVQNPGNASHILVLLRDPVDDRTHPLSSLVWESFDGGASWATATALDHHVGGITDAAIVGSATYLVGYSSEKILRLDYEGGESF